MASRIVFYGISNIWPDETVHSHACSVNSRTVAFDFVGNLSEYVLHCLQWKLRFCTVVGNVINCLPLHTAIWIRKSKFDNEKKIIYFESSRRWRNVLTSANHFGRSTQAIGRCRFFSSLLFMQHLKVSTCNQASGNRMILRMDFFRATNMLSFLTVECECTQFLVSKITKSVSSFHFCFRLTYFIFLYALLSHVTASD